MNESPGVETTLPAAHRREVEGLLQPGETVLAHFEPDLDRQMRYVSGLVVLTDRRLLALEEDRPEGNGKFEGLAAQWKTWHLAADIEIRAHDHGGVGTLELLSPTGRLAYWRYTAAVAADAHRLVQKRSTTSTGLDGQPPAAIESVCPSCGAVISTDEGVCRACTPHAAQPTMSALLRLIRFARPTMGLALVGFLLTVAGTAAGLVPPYLTMPLLDRVLIPYQTGEPADFNLVYWYLGGLFGAALLAWGLDGARLYVLSRVSERVSANLRRQTYSHLQRLSLEFFGGKRTGDLIARVSNDTDRICNFLSINLVDFATDILMILMTATILVTIDPLLAVAALCPFPIIVWLVYRLRGRFLRGYRQAGVAWSSMTSVLADTIPGIRVVKAFAQEQREIERFDHANERVFHVNDRLNRVWAVLGPTVTFLTTGGLLVVWAFAAWRVYHHDLTVGMLTAFLAYISRFYTRIESMIRMASVTQRASASAQRIFEILDRVPSVPEPVRPVHPGRIEGRIELRGVRFKYGSREVLHGLDLQIEAGEMIGLVGPSGAGKTTLINLLCRFYDVSTGAILVDGTDVRSYPVEEFRRNIGIVLQEPFLFFGTVAENIAYGRPDASRAEIVAAARAARAHDFILNLPDGYDSLVGERGQSLSGGERQRLSIARALLIDPRILILDEATSSVDSETEQEIQAALDNLVQGRTTIAIAHRLSTLRRADRLVVLERGHIVEIGKHDDLLQADGTYARLHRAQMEAMLGHMV